MKAILKKIGNIAKIALTVVVVCIMLLTIFSVVMSEDQGGTLFGYKLMIVLSDSMKATHFEAGDVIIVKNVDADVLKPGDVISFISTSPGSYGRMVTHRIREIHWDDNGKRSFVTYGTTSGINDDEPVTEENLVGIYKTRIPKVGKFFSFLKTTQGYLLCILLPFLLLIAYYGISSIRYFRKYYDGHMAEIRQEMEKLERQKRELEWLRQGKQAKAADPEEEEDEDDEDDEEFL